MNILSLSSPICFFQTAYVVLPILRINFQKCDNRRHLDLTASYRLFYLITLWSTPFIVMSVSGAFYMGRLYDDCRLNNRRCGSRFTSTRDCSYPFYFSWKGTGYFGISVIRTIGFRLFLFVDHMLRMPLIYFERQ